MTPEVRGFQVGDRVLGRIAFGGDQATITGRVLKVTIPADGERVADVRSDLTGQIHRLHFSQLEFV